jgi:hypothetical protein
MMKPLNLLFAAGAFAFVLSGCGETPQTNVAKAGQSAAKEGDKPYQNDQFKGNREEWAKTLRSRADNQNEYKRVN